METFFALSHTRVSQKYTGWARAKVRPPSNIFRMVAAGSKDTKPKKGRRLQPAAGDRAFNGRYKTYKSYKRYKR